MAAIMAVCCVIGLVILLLGHKRIEHRAKQAVVAEQTLEMIEKY
jgi:hypothetical protein